MGKFNEKTQGFNKNLKKNINNNYNKININII